MCGIFGIAALNQSYFVSQTALDIACQKLQNRGPDGRGTWLKEDACVGFAHTRLAIVDLNIRASQPMLCPGEKIAITFNGEIYNHLDLRCELESKGYTFFTKGSDTEVILIGYREWGIEGLLSRIDGMFAFGLWDGDSKTLHLCRDHSGIKPLYYQVSEQRIVFSSDIPAICTLDDVLMKLNLNAVGDYLTYLCVPAPNTLIDGVRKLPAGHVLSICSRSGYVAEPKSYWDRVPGNANVQVSNISIEDAARGTLSAIDQSVKKMLQADVPVGIYLSGGVDSTALAYFARRHFGGRLNCFTVCYDGSEIADESMQAIETARTLDLTHHILRLSEETAIPRIDEIIASQGEPLADWVCIPLFLMAEATATAGIKSVLVGEGADEAFAGYSGYFSQVAFSNRYEQMLHRFPPLILECFGLFTSYFSRWSRHADEYSDILIRLGRGNDSFLSGAVGFRESEIELLSSELRGDPARLGKIILCGRSSKASQSALSRLTYCEFKLRLPELLLMRTDKMTMAHGVEARLPFLDVSLMEFLSDLPDNVRVPNGPKSLLKIALAEILPDSIIFQNKVGFGVPMSAWLRGPFGEKAERYILGSDFFSNNFFNGRYVQRLFNLHRSGRRDCSVKIWALYNLVRWRDIMGVTL